jgi:threonine/homoserine/homoserine lactone efflux protein
MDFGLVFQGIVVGFGVAAPVGPIGILVIRRSVSGDASLGFATGLGAAVADAIFAVLGSLGLFAVAARLGPHEALLRGVGGAFVGVLGARAVASGQGRRDVAASKDVRHAHARAFATTFLLTITNPMTIAPFAAIAASIGVGSGSAHGTSGEALWFVLGVFVGSSAWWFALSRAASHFRGRLSARSLVWTDRVSGVVLLAFAAIAVISAVQSLFHADNAVVPARSLLVGAGVTRLGA